MSLLLTTSDRSDGKFPTPGRVVLRSAKVTRPEHQQAITIAADVIGHVVGSFGSLLTIQAADGRRFYGRGDATRGDRVQFSITRDPRDNITAAGNVRVTE